MLAFALSWIALFAVGRSGSFGPTFLSLGWIHLVALGWITSIALAVLLHAIPSFLDVDWHWSEVARVCVAVFVGGVALLVLGFFGNFEAALEAGASTAFAALLVYAAATAQPLALALRGERPIRAVAQAFGITLAFLIVAGALGTAFTYAFADRLPAGILDGLPQAHALLGIGGWLTLLVVGVSARTMKPIAGVRSRQRWMHIAASTSILFGTAAAAAGAAGIGATVLIAGCALLLLGTVVYAADVADILRRATVPHKPPQVFMAFAVLWAVVAAALALGAAYGAPWSAGSVYVALIGWAGSAVMAHLHHIGVRVIITNVRGSEDETRPNAVLTASLTWTTTALFEIAVVAGGTGALQQAPYLVEFAAVSGFVACLVMVANLAGAIVKARDLPISIA